MAIGAKAEAFAGQSIKAFIDPKDIAQLAVFLASGASAYVTGQALTVCGGSHMRA
jgi:NAD(P)-dependent dehydrogenase (short-subunit alcohol dehydrogenase family)